MTGKVYVPSRGYDTLERVQMTEADEVEVAEHAARSSSFTVITPMQYYGQKETEPYIRASILLDGTDSPLIGSRHPRHPARRSSASACACARSVWRPRSASVDRARATAGRALGAVIERWEPTGEPDVDPRRSGVRVLKDRMIADANDIAIVAIAQTPAYRRYHDSEPTLIMRCVNDLLAETGLDRHDIDFTIAGSCDYLSGMPFAFVSNIDGVGAWPPVYESHVEMDGAWALYEAWMRLQVGDIDLALVDRARASRRRAGPARSSRSRPTRT